MSCKEANLQFHPASTKHVSVLYLMVHGGVKPPLVSVSDKRFVVDWTLLAGLELIKNDKKNDKKNSK